MSENVRNLTAEIVDENVKEMAVRLSWDHPCNTNGEVHYFTITLDGESYVENLTEKDSFTVTVPKSPNLPRPYKIDKRIEPAINYTLNIYPNDLVYSLGTEVFQTREGGNKIL